jgi:hypothetical protein
MASYMPSFMSKSLSTGAEAAYGQPFAFTTGIEKVVGTPPNSENAKKGKKKTKPKKPKQDAKENKGQKQNKTTPKPKKVQLTFEHKNAMKNIHMKLVMDQGKACQISTSYDILKQAFRTAKISEIERKIAILLQYPGEETSKTSCSFARQ